MTKTQRQHRISEIISEHSVSTAAQIVTLLEEEGVSATQATVTRDLQDIGAVKMRDADGKRRIQLSAPTATGSAPLDHLRRMMGEWATSIDNSGHLVIIRTPPGCAHVVASALDRGAMSGVLGTVAGDDTILVVAKENYGGPALAENLRRLAGLESRKGKK
jgi:transcriptional regulator of arginine metabolism